MAHPPRIPVWLPPGQDVVYFITFCVQDRRPVLANAATLRALEHALTRLTDWWVYAAILMPDHLHLLAAPTRDRETPVGNLTGALKRWIRQELRTSATTTASGALALQQTGDAQNQIVGQPPRLASLNWQWQTGSFDRLLRRDESAQAKWEYIRENPVRKKLVKDWRDWPFKIGFG
jgi:putative transposase